MNNLLTLLTQLAPMAATFAPGTGQIPLIAAAVANLVAYIRQQSDMTTDQILQRAGVTLDDNERMLLEDQIRLQGNT